MDFDPLSLFTPIKSGNGDDEAGHGHANINSFSNTQKSLSSTLNNPGMDHKAVESDYLQPIHVLDLPLLQVGPPIEVLLLFLKLLAPPIVHNFGPSKIVEDVKNINVKHTFEEKQVTNLIDPSLPWLRQWCPRFDTELKLAALPILSGDLKLNYEAEYNAWLTRIISTATDEKILKLASLRVAENCGRTAQPEIIRVIDIPYLNQLGISKTINLKEPSLTSDNLGLKTWGSALILGQRLVNQTIKDGSMINCPLLKEPILELGAGTGLVGIVCNLLNYRNVMLTDLPEIVPNLRDNVELNELDCSVDELDWTKPDAFLEKYGSNSYNTIILSDPIYSDKHPYWVRNMVKMFLNKIADARVIIQIPLRRLYEKERASLWGLLNEDFEVHHEEIEDGADDFGNMRFLYKELRWKHT